MIADEQLNPIVQHIIKGEHPPLPLPQCSFSNMTSPANIDPGDLLRARGCLLGISGHHDVMCGV